MAMIYNSDLTKELADAGKLQVSRDKIPNQLADKIVPVMEVNPKLLRRTNFIRSGQVVVTGGSTILAANTFVNKKLFITSIAIGLCKDVACDVPTGSMTIVATPMGDASRTLLNLPVLTLTAQQQETSVTFLNPLEIDTTIAITLATQTYAAGLMSRTYAIYGYVVDNPNA